MVDDLAPDTAPYPEHITPPTSPEETRALVHTLVETLPDDVVDALCRLLAWRSRPVGRREG